MNRRGFLAGVGAAATATLSGCAVLQADTQGDVQMRSVSFDPAEYTVEVGDEVTWHNPSTRSHTVTAYEDGIPAEGEYFASGGFDSEAAARDGWSGGDFGGAVTSGESYSHAFEVAGTFNYVCIPHETGGMIGRVVVEE